MKTLLITGGTSGIGEATARHAVAEGHQVSYHCHLASPRRVDKTPGAHTQDNTIQLDVVSISTKC